MELRSKYNIEFCLLLDGSLRVGNTTDRHIVYQHVVVAAADLFHQLLQPVFHQQLRRVGGRQPGRGWSPQDGVAGRMMSVWL